MLRKNAGYLLADLLVGLLLVSFTIQGAVTVLSNHTLVHAQQDRMLTMEQNLRVGMDRIVDELRGAAYAVPDGDPAEWMPWVSTMTSNPEVTADSPATVRIARCSATLADFSTDRDAGETQLTLNSRVPDTSLADALNNTTKRLIVIRGSEYAHITSITGNTVNIDTDPTQTGNQGLSRRYTEGTPVCRVDVLTFAIATDDSPKALTFDENQGEGPVAIAEGIENLEVATITAEEQYQITLTARAENPDPMSGAVLTRTRSTNVTVRNAS